jgi:hypothetical protein
MRKFFVIILTIFSGIFSHTYGQLDNRLFHDQYTLLDQDSGAIKLGFDVSGYFWNNEYSSEIAPGYTLFGYQFRPYLSYYPAKSLRLDVGGFFMKDFGDSSFADIRPLLTIKYQKRNFSFLFGSLEGAATHRLIEPLYYLQHIINRRIEDGVQFKWVSDRLFLDVWLEWVNMIRFGDDEQEEFNMGISFNYRVYESENFNIEIPFQFLANHRGGQIDVNDLPAETIFNAAFGFSLIFPVRDVSWFKSIRSDNYFVDFFTTEKPVQLPYDQGQGLFLHLTGQFKWFDLAFSYWKGDKFFAPQGTPIYQSVSMDFSNNGYTEEKRELLFIRLMLEHNFKGGLSLAFRFEPVYDFGINKLDHMEVLFLRYKTDFLLNKKRKK